MAPSATKGLQSTIHVCQEDFYTTIHIRHQKPCTRRSTYATKGLYMIIHVCHQRLANDSISHQRLVNGDPRKPPKTCKRQSTYATKGFYTTFHARHQKPCTRRSTYTTKGLYTTIHVCHERPVNDSTCHLRLVNGHLRKPPKTCKRLHLQPKACKLQK